MNGRTLQPEGLVRLRIQSRVDPERLSPRANDALAGFLLSLNQRHHFERPALFDVYKQKSAARAPEYLGAKVDPDLVTVLYSAPSHANLIAAFEPRDFHHLAGLDRGPPLSVGAEQLFREQHTTSFITTEIGAALCAQGRLVLWRRTKILTFELSRDVHVVDLVQLTIEKEP